MAKSKIESLIREGLSTSDIQKQIKEFPEEVTTQYLESLGYDQVEAIRYKWLLRKNDQNCRERKKEECRRELAKNKALIISKNADPNNILIDVCAFQFKDGIDIIDKSERATVLYAVIKEMDKVACKKEEKENMTERSKFLLHNIRHYALEMLLNKSKYQLVPYENSEMSYVDDVIIEYLKTLSPRKRPTLLTADKLLALRADCLELEFILVAESLNVKSVEDTSRKAEITKSNKREQKEKSDENQDKEVADILGISLKVIYSEEVLKIDLSFPTMKVFAVKGDDVKEIKQKDEIKFSHFDYIVIINKKKKHKNIRIGKVKIEKRKIHSEIKKCEFVNDIYKLDLPEALQDTVRKILIQ